VGRGMGRRLKNGPSSGLLIIFLFCSFYFHFLISNSSLNFFLSDLNLKLLLDAPAKLHMMHNLYIVFIFVLLLFPFFLFLIPVLKFKFYSKFKTIIYLVFEKKL
jgi:hypothetical protein